ncbi:MAG TPA: Ig-like domain-containing protein [Verrucomicrobiales bacterium]|nr:Ig-like domain-containing protein [Verrucomicrobiales bacterium]
MKKPARAAILVMASFSFCLLKSLQGQTTIVPSGASWKYLDNGTDPGTAWRAPAFDDGAWASGSAELGYGDGDEATVVSFGSNSSAKYATTYFRHSFTITNPADYPSLKVRLIRDDGAVVYLNGSEIRRDNMPAGTVSFTTLASTALGAPQESTVYETIVSGAGLVAGTNVLAAEIHQANGISTDLSFKLELIGLNSAVNVTRGPYLQLGTPTGIIVRWRTDTASDSRVRFGTAAGSLTATADDAAQTTEHLIQLSGLTPGTQYFYSVGTTAATLAAGPDYTFFTAPPAGRAQSTRVWVLGDSGTGDSTAAAVRDGYTAFGAGRYTDVWLMLGDNAYETGSDAEFQTAVFDMYPSYLRQTPLWSAIGNHETAQATNPPLTIPYFQNFTFPAAGEAGGAASGTEKYYSFDYGRIHFIALDSMTSSRLPGGTMLEWLRADLEFTSQDWIIAFWHHPVYSKGSHDSDTATESVQMRENILPVLEAGGVDLVLAGHSHCYERSFFIDGHYGVSSTFNPSMKLDGGSGRTDAAGAYTKPAGLPANQGAVYAVAGNGGKVSNWTGGSTAEFNPSPHPAMYYSALHTGSMVIDINGDRLDAKMILTTGAVDDYFSIVKNVPNSPPSVAISSPAAGAAFQAPANIEITATATDVDGTVQQVDFYANDVPIGTAATAPFSITWNNVPAGNYALSAAATDNLGATVPSTAVNITVNPGVPPPAAPSGLAATAVAKTQINLTWTDNSTGETGFQIERSVNNSGAFERIAQVNPDTVSYSDRGVLANKTYFYRVRAFSTGGQSAYSNTASAKTPRK